MLHLNEFNIYFSVNSQYSLQFKIPPNESLPLKSYCCMLHYLFSNIKADIQYLL